jgi:hypothetical protein
MVTIELARPWTYRTPLKTIAYQAGTHEVFQYVADAAEAEGALGEAPAAPKDPLDGSVADLIAYLEGVDDIAEVRALIAAEQGGKTRVGALAALQARKAALQG